MNAVKFEYDMIPGLKKYVIVDSNSYCCGRYDTLEETYEKMSKLPHLKKYRVLVEISSIAFDSEIYFRLDGSRYEL